MRSFPGWLSSRWLFCPHSFPPKIALWHFLSDMTHLWTSTKSMTLCFKKCLVQNCYYSVCPVKYPDRCWLFVSVRRHWKVVWVNRNVLYVVCSIQTRRWQCLEASSWTTCRLLRGSWRSWGQREETTSTSPSSSPARRLHISPSYSIKNRTDLCMGVWDWLHCSESAESLGLHITSRPK